MLKAGCERMVERDFPGRTLIFRAGLIIGPHETVGRLPTWLKRFAEAGADARVLAPGDPGRPMGCIDARDVALFGLHCVATGAQGPYIVAGPVGGTTYGD